MSDATERFSPITESGADTGITVDAHGAITGWSVQTQEILGFPPEQALGRRLVDFLAVSSASEDTAGGDVVDSASSDAAIVVRRSDGSTLACDVRIRPDLSQDPPAWSLHLATGAAHQPEPDRAILEALFNESPVGLCYYDADLRLRRFNFQAEGMQGIFSPRSLGLCPSEMWPNSNAQEFEDVLRKAVEDGVGVTSFEKHGYPPGDPEHEHIFSTSASLLHDGAGHVLGVADTAVDITSRRQAEARLDLIAEASAQIGTTLDVVRTGQELADVAVPRLAHAVAVDVLDGVLRGEEPGPGAEDQGLRRIGLRHSSRTPSHTRDPLFESAGYPFPPSADRCLAELQPYLSRPEEPASERERTHGAPANREEPLALVVPLCAREAKLGVVTFYRFGGDFDEADTRTAVDLVSRAAVCIDNARRYTREHSVAQSLQHDLLPSRFPRQSAVEVAQSLVTADGGTEWFDVVPVSSARVALVVGSLKGRGLYAAGAMGRLRTAVHALAGLDLGPDEVLGRLDGLVTRITAEREHEGAAGCPDGAVVGATCLYAVYDPTSGRLTLASAGHPAPVVVDPDGNTHPIDIPTGAALGTGDDPFGMVDVDVPPGSTLALYTPGLVSGEGTGEPASFLADLVSRPDVPLHDLCREVVATLLPGEYRHDALLLLARTHLLREDQFVSWDLPSDPAIVGTARSLVARQLAAWNLEEATFSTQLIASELVTNSIRYAEGPIQLRLLRDRALICEVSDGSTTAPHLRFAGTGDEGGRGLFMTAELTHQWGTRFGEHGKTIWTEQPLPGEG